MIAQPKGYQTEAKNNVLDIFRYANAQIDAATDPDSRRAAIAHNGCVLIQAPTGAGKTLIAGLVAQELSRDPDIKIVWLWFTPFAGLVEQARIAIKAEFNGLRVRDIARERRAHGTRSGDVFVSTWAAVAGRKDSKRIRKDGDESVSLDLVLEQWRKDGFKIGVIVDEAHHTFSSGTESVRYYREVLQPDFTLMITATPDDQDAESFRKSAGIAIMHRITVSRLDAVSAGLIKPGIKSVAYLAGEQHRELVDFGQAALADGVRVHNAIKAQLVTEGIDLVPLMLVQVASTDKSVEKAKMDLMALGMAEDAIAVYTSKEPDDDLLAVARDESKEALIFKMAVALGFDAPRAFTLVSMRGAQDKDFGTQIVGRILRVDWRLQNRATSELLKYGYVFLADADKQSGLSGAADRINAVRTELAQVSPFTMLVKLGDSPTVQVVESGQTSLLPNPWSPPSLPYEKSDPSSSGGSISGQEFFNGFIFETNNIATQKKDTGQKPYPLSSAPGMKTYPLRGEMDRVFKQEQLNLDTSGLLSAVEARIRIDDSVFTAGFRQAVSIQRKEEEIFTHDVHYGEYQARLSDAEIARRAQLLLFEPDYLDPRELQAALLNRLRKECSERGFLEVLESPEKLRQAMHLILVSHPKLLREAVRICCAENAELVDTAPLPEVMSWPTGCAAGRLAAYQAFPPDLNSHELEFAKLLDVDMSGQIVWWHRNEPRKPWSAGLVMPDGTHYYPDFLVKIKGRNRGDGILMVEVKGEHLINSMNTPDKAAASHKLYRKPLMVMKESSGRWMTLRYNDRTGKNEPDAIFRLDALAEY
ncbi:MAG: DEAD/DEAH box helicase family protein [Desulfuromonadales bacterium]|nr:DEAD/DEAH box helicase family protein [Desulfuromonadales bacterium]